MAIASVDWGGFEVVPLGALPSLGPDGRPPRPWGERHGQAVVIYRSHFLNRALNGPRRLELVHDASFVDGATLPDGSRVRAAAIGRGRTWRRPLIEHQRVWTDEAVLVPVPWQWGRLDIANDGIRFVDVARPPTAAFAAITSNLERPIYNDPVLRGIVRESAEAVQAFGSIGGTRMFRRLGDDIGDLLGWDRAVTLAAEMRDLGETASDFDRLPLPPGGERFNSAFDRILLRLEEMGWDVTRS